jgi:hypothetical protein
LWVSLVSFAATTLCVVSQLVFIVVSVYFVMTQSGNFWIYPRTMRKHARTSHSQFCSRNVTTTTGTSQSRRSLTLSVFVTANCVMLKNG